MTPLKLVSYFVVFLLVLLSAQAQQRSQPQSLLPTSNSDSERMLEDHVSSMVAEYKIWQAKRLQNPQGMQRLREEVLSGDMHVGGEAEVAQETLAKLGDGEQFAHVSYEVYAKDPFIQA